MKLLLITGPSGCGKSTTILPYLSKRLGGTVIETGDIFKAQAGWQRIRGRGEQSNRLPNTIRTGEVALLSFIASGRFQIGLEEYEQGKLLGDFTGYEIIQYIEAYRYLCPDLPARSVHAIHKTTDRYGLAITTAINYQEMCDLVNIYGSDYVYHLALSPMMDLAKREGDNRTTVPFSKSRGLVGEILDYCWENLQTRLDEVIEGVKKWTTN